MCVLQTLPEGNPSLYVTPPPAREDGFNDLSSLLITKAPWYVCNPKSEAHPAGMGCSADIYDCLPMENAKGEEDPVYLQAWREAGCLKEDPKPDWCGENGL